VRRFEIIIKGKVQKVGYRDYVEEVARRFNIVGFVENLKDGNVRILCEADEKIIDDFLKAINVKNGLTEVEKIIFKDIGVATGEFQHFEIKYGPLEEEIGERMATAVKYAAAMWSDIKEVKTDIKEMKSDIKEMKNDIKEMKSDIKEMKTDNKEIKEDVKIVIKKEDEIAKNILDLRLDLKSYLDDRFKKIEEEINLIKSKIGLL